MDYVSFMIRLLMVFFLKKKKHEFFGYYTSRNKQLTIYYLERTITKMHKDMPMHVRAEKPILPNRMIFFEIIIEDKCISDVQY